MKRTPLRRNKPMRKRRSKPRPGRLKGTDMTELRNVSWDEKRGRCHYCHLPANRELGELAHIRNKRMWGDNKENVSPAHKRCHELYHAYGPSLKKPVPKKPGMETA